MKKKKEKKYKIINNSKVISEKSEKKIIKLYGNKRNNFIPSKLKYLDKKPEPKKNFENKNEKILDGVNMESIEPNENYFENFHSNKNDLLSSTSTQNINFPNKSINK